MSEDTPNEQPQSMPLGPHIEPGQQEEHDQQSTPGSTVSSANEEQVDHEAQSQQDATRPDWRPENDEMIRKAEATTGATFTNSLLLGANFGRDIRSETTFENGRYTELFNFDPEKFDKETEESVRIFREWAEGLSPSSWPSERIQETVQRTRSDRAVERVWVEKFSGRVPKHWGEVEAGATWHVIRDDIKDEKVEFTDDMVEAAIKHPVGHVHRALLESRKLTQEQLKMLEDYTGLS